MFGNTSQWHAHTTQIFYKAVITCTQLKFSDRSYNTDPNPWETTSKIRRLPHNSHIFISMHLVFHKSNDEYPFSNIHLPNTITVHLTNCKPHRKNNNAHLFPNYHLSIIRKTNLEMFLFLVFLLTPICLSLNHRLSLMTPLMEPFQQGSFSMKTRRFSLQRNYLTYSLCCHFTSSMYHEQGLIFLTNTLQTK